MTNTRLNALLSGSLLMIMGTVAGYCIGALLPEFYNSTAPELVDNLQDYKMVLLGIIVTIVLDFIVSYTLYKFFEPVNKKLSQIAGIIRLVYSVIFSIAAIFLFQNLSVTNLTTADVQRNFSLFQTVWISGLALFGFHVILLGVLSKMHKRVPKLLWMITLIAGASYTLISVLKLIYPASETIIQLEMILAIPMAIGELGLAIWFLVKGGRENVKTL
jgi:hypothetical protein